MPIAARIENSLEQAIAYAQGPGAPPLLASALRYVVFPGGHRIRPRLCVSVAHACGDDDPEAANSAASAIELLHCASLVHDDLPCFDDAPIRRGKPSVHVEYGEPIAVLAGDALIVLAFETIARGAANSPHRMSALLRTIASSVAGAIAAGAEPEPWRMLGATLGEAYQVADDLRDILCDEEELGKPIGQDAARLRPNAAALLGIGGAKNRLEQLVRAAVESIPPCPGAVELRAAIKAQTAQFFPRQLAREAA
jgi:geranylgeranyl diphosphate synthase type II